MPRARRVPGRGGLRLQADHRGRSALAGLQDLEYALEAIARSEGYRREGHIRFAQGACVLWKRDVLSRALEAHSGMDDGGDAELSALALAAGYRTIYDCGVEVRTKAVVRPWRLVRQRVRWYRRTRVDLRGLEQVGPLKLARDLRKLLRGRGYLTEKKDVALLPLYPFYKATLVTLALMARGRTGAGGRARRP